MADDVKSIIIQDLRYSKFLLTVDESTFANQFVLLAFVRSIEDSRICEELHFMKIHQRYRGTGMQRSCQDCHCQDKLSPFA